MTQFKYEDITKKIIGAAISQARNYLEVYNLEAGLLLNFGGMSLEFKRLENAKYSPNLTSKKFI